MLRKQHHLKGLTLIALAMQLGTSGCLRTWQKDVTVNGIHFMKLGHSERSGRYAGVLSEDTVIEGFPCRQGWAHFESDMKLRSFCANEPISTGVSELPAGTWVQLKGSASPRVCALPETMTVQGFLCKGTGGPKGVQIALYPSGRLSCFFAPKDVEIDGVPCKGGVFHMIQLHENGRLKQGRLTREIVINGVTYPAKRTLRFNLQGEVIP